MVLKWIFLQLYDEPMLLHQNDLALHGLCDLELLQIELWFYYVELIVYDVIYMNLCWINVEGSMRISVWRFENA